MYWKIAIVKPEQKVANIQKGIDNNTPKKNLFLALSPCQDTLDNKRIIGTKKGCANNMKRSKFDELHQPIQNVHHPLDSK